MSTVTIDQDSANGILAAYSAGSIDGKTQGNTTIFTTANNGKNFYCIAVDFILTTVSVLVTPAVVSVGWTPAGYTDLVNAQALATLLTTQGKFYRLPMTTADCTAIPPNTAVVCRVATGANATAYTFQVVLRGYYL